MVKLIFELEARESGYTGERMWVEITYRNLNNFKGILSNDPFHISELKSGQEISFQIEHICDTDYNDPNQSKWDYYFDTKIIVSNDVLEKNEFNFMLRDDPKDTRDSGWSVLSGYEDDRFLSDSDNFQYISIGVILNIDDSILSFMDEPPLCAYERDERGTFYKIDDYDWESYFA